MSNLSRKHIIIGLVIWVIAIVATIAIALVFNNKDNDNEIIRLKKNKSENIYKVEYLDTYDGNNIEIKRNEDKAGFEYLQISGLKDTKFQEKINEEIHTKTKKVYEKSKDEDYSNIESIVEFNSNNLLSIFISNVGFYDYENSVIEVVNYNLETKKELELKDLFFDEQVMYTLLSQGFSKDYAKNRGTLHSKKFNEDKAANVEEDVFKTIQNIKNDDYIFYFDSKHIYTISNLRYSDIDVLSNLDEMVYFKKYKVNPSIYDSTYEGLKNTYVFSWNRYPYDFYRVELNDTIMVDYHILGDSESPNSKIYEYAKINENIDKYIKSANSNKFTYIMGDGYVYYDSDDVYHINDSYEICTTDLSNKDDLINLVVKSHNYQPHTINYEAIDLKDYDYITCKEFNNSYEVNDSGLISKEIY